MAESQDSAFSRVLRAFQSRLSQNEIDKFRFATFEELKEAIIEIQKTQAQRRGYRNLNKIRPFLDGVGQYSKVIEVFVNAKPDIMAFIWVCASDVSGNYRMLNNAAIRDPSSYVYRFDRTLSSVSIQTSFLCVSVHGRDICSLVCSCLSILLTSFLFDNVWHPPKGGILIENGNSDYFKVHGSF